MMKEKKVKSYVDGGAFGPRPVYLISGIKLAKKGLRVSAATSKTKEGEMEGSVQATDKATVGAAVGGGKESSDHHSFIADDERVFAYQLHKITKSGWSGEVDVSLHVDKAGFLSRNADTGDDGPYGLEPASMDDVHEFTREQGENVRLGRIKEAGEDCVFFCAA